MLRTEEMCELSLLVPHQDIEAVTRAIAEEAVLHQVDTSYLGRQDDWQADHWQERIQDYQSIEQRVLLLMSTLEMPPVAYPLERELDVRSDLAGIRERVVTIESDVMPLLNELKVCQQRLHELEAMSQRLEPMAKLDVDLGALRGLTFLHAQIGVLPTTNLDRLNVSLLHVPHVILTLGTEGAVTLVAIFGAAKDSEILEKAARSAYLSPISIPEEYRGTPSEILQNVRAEIVSLSREREDLVRQIAERRARWGSELQSLLWRVRADLSLLHAAERCGQVRDTYLVAGWVPTRRATAIIDKLQRLTGGRVIADAVPAERSGDFHAVPTALNNKGIWRAFEGLVTNYSWPAYGEIDPTPLVALTFIAMFGLMFGDVGHGLILALVGLLSLSGKVPSLKKLAGLAPVLAGSGLSAMLFGFLYGSIFGIENLLPAFWLRPLEGIMSILLATVAFGVVVSLIGFAANIVNGLRTRDWRRAFFDRYGVAGVWFYLALIGVVVAQVRRISLPPMYATISLLIAPLLLIALGEPLANLLARHRPLIQDSIGLYIVQSFFELFEALISYLSGSLSFVRLGAFAVAHGGLSAVIFILADVVGGTALPLYWLVVALGNLFIIGFEGLIVGIQTLRLEYYEFFSKFFRGGGMPYRPLRLYSEKQ